MISKEIVINKRIRFGIKAAALLYKKHPRLSQTLDTKGRTKSEREKLLGILSLSVGRGEKVLLLRMK